MPNNNPVPPVTEDELEFNPGVKYAGMILLGLGLGGLVLWLSPITLTELLATFILPLSIFLALLASFGLIGRGFMELVNSKELGLRVQQYLKKQMEQDAKNAKEKADE